ncbi:MAG: phenylalanine--tRNA ligase subunit beta [Woeseiaceae bacterium]|nr:phenylalanine--tRNA ligase subunit beta [Woeseiaceae bacterium]
MKVAESWLRKWVDPDLDTMALAHQLTMLGHEVDGVEAIGEGLDGVVIGEIVSFEKHPDADRLNVCQVSVDTGETLEIVCGAPNVSQGMKSPLAPVGVTLPNGLKIKKSKIRGVVSHGMLCSAVELGLGDESDGIMDLPSDAPTGESFADFLGLPDAAIDLDLTPNRGDCFCLLGIARDLSVVTGSPLASTEIEPVAATIDEVHPVVVEDTSLCPSFGGRVISGIDPSASTPLWMCERLRRAGLRPIHPVVDVTNYVMLELGQPCHAYDLDLIDGPIAPRLAKKGERVVLLDEKEIEVNGNTIVISDDSGAIGLAGIMGGLSTAVSDKTTRVFFEAAFWPTEHMAGQARSYGLHTDASLRFERGVDPHQQMRAVEFATSLILDICGGSAGPAEHTVDADVLPVNRPIGLRRERLEKLLGVGIDDARVEAILGGLELTIEKTEDGWTATPPSHRFDLAIEADLIEEVARIHGYDEIPEATAVAAMPLAASTESTINLDTIASVLVGRDYQEVITYSFIDEGHDQLFSGTGTSISLSNPISSEMSVMRGSLWPGMLSAAAANVARQQARVRFFEIGRSFHGTLEEPEEVVRVAGVCIGLRNPEQWAEKASGIDFFDVKADVEAMLRLTGHAADIQFAVEDHPALQPGQSAAILRGGDRVGVLGKLHPNAAKAIGLKQSAFVFELDAERAFASEAPTAEEVSRFPRIRRDIAVVVDDEVNAGELVDTIMESASGLVKGVRIFDIYTGEGIEAGRKSVALGLILQETSRTLTDDDADTATAQAVQLLQQKHAAELRD